MASRIWRTVQTLDLAFTHNGFTAPDGSTWFMEQPSFSPGFNVNFLIDFRLSNYFNLRLSPGMYFGNREVKMVDTTPRRRRWPEYQIDLRGPASRSAILGNTIRQCQAPISHGGSHGSGRRR